MSTGYNTNTTNVEPPENNQRYGILRRTGGVVEDLEGTTKVVESSYYFKVLETDELHGSSVYLCLESCAFIYDFDCAKFNGTKYATHQRTPDAILQRKLNYYVVLYPI